MTSSSGTLSEVIDANAPAHLLTKAEVAERYRIHIRTVERLIDAQVIGPVVRLRRIVRIPETSLPW